MQDPFAALGLTPEFAADISAIETRYRDLAKALHPDRHMDKTPGERRLILTRALEVNEAFRLLKDPVGRAEAVANSMGIQAMAESSQKVSQELLIEMMEAREELAEIARSANHSAFDSVAKRTKDRCVRLIERLTVAFRARQPLDDDARREVVQLIHELRYMQRFYEELQAIEEAVFESVA